MNWEQYQNNSLTSQLGSFNQPVGASQYSAYGTLAPQTQTGFALGQNLIGNPNQFSNTLTGAAGAAGTGGILDTLKGFAPLAQLGFTGLQTIGGLIGANRAYGLAKDQFKHIRDVTNTNLTNQIQSYNTALADRARTRAAMEGGSQEDAERYIEQNRLRR